MVVEVAGVQGEGGGAAAGGFEVQADQEGVEGGVVAGGRGDVVDGGELVVGERGVGFGGGVVCGAGRQRDWWRG